MRQVVGAEVIVHENRHYFIQNSARIDYDVGMFRHHLFEATSASSDDERELALTRAVRAYRGPFLEGIESEWVQLSRDELHLKFTAALTELADAACRRSDWRTAIELAARATESDPLNEFAVELQMLAFAAAGRIASARHAVDQYVSAARAHGATPSQNLRALSARLDSPALTDR